MDWLKKLGEYAPDIVGAIASGGATLPATALRVISKELLGYEVEDVDAIGAAVKSATPEQMAALTKANNTFKIELIKLQNEESEKARRSEVDEMASARKSYGKHNQQADKIADKITTWNIPYILFMVVLNCGVVYLFRNDAALVAIASNLIGMAINSLVSQLQSVTGFYFGSSIGSKAKASK